MNLEAVNSFIWALYPGHLNELNETAEKHEEAAKKKLDSKGNPSPVEMQEHQSVYANCILVKTAKIYRDTFFISLASLALPMTAYALKIGPKNETMAFAVVVILNFIRATYNLSHYSLIARGVADQWSAGAIGGEPRYCPEDLKYVYKLIKV